MVSFPVFIIGLGDGKAWSLISGVFEVIYCNFCFRDNHSLSFIFINSWLEVGSSLLCMLLVAARQSWYFVYYTDFTNTRKERCFFAKRYINTCQISSTPESWSM